MPVVVIFFVRQLIVIGVQLGIFAVIDRFVTPLLNRAISAIAQAFGVSESEASDILANEVIQTAESLGLTVLLSRAKLPLVISDRLGFTSKGFKKRPLKPATEAKVNASKKLANSTAKLTSSDSQAIAQEISRSGRWGLREVALLVGIITGIVSVPVGIFFTIAQYIDFANWQGPYQKTAQKILAIFGLNPDTPLPKAGVISDDIWKRIYSTVEELGPRGISFPFSGVDKPYSRANLADLVNEIAANLIKAGGDATFKNVIGLVLPLIQLGGAPISSPLPSSTAQKPTQVASATPEVKVFTGVLGQGTLGNGLQFTPRADDLIESLEELKQAINNNASPYLAALLSKVSYELKLVSSVTVNGVRLTGGSQRIQSGTSASGEPKYKSVVNKFATLTFYLATERGTRTKLTTINLGPVNALAFQPTQAELDSLALSIAKDLITSNTDEVSRVVSNTPTASEFRNGGLSAGVSVVNTNRKFSAPPGATTPEFFDTRDPANRFVRAEKTDMQDLLGAGNDVYEVYRIVLENIRNNGGQTINSAIVNWAKNITPYEADQMRVFYKGGVATVSPPAPAPTQEIQPSEEFVPNQALPALAQIAATLHEFYGALGLQLPTLDARGRLYESFGLGPAAFYIGTAEQNTRLLKALKQKGI